MTVNRKRDGFRRGDGRSRRTGAQIGNGKRSRRFQLATDRDEASATGGGTATQFAVDDLPARGTEHDDVAAGGYHG